GPTRSSCRRRAAPTPMPCSRCPRCASGSKRRSARPWSFRSSTWPSEDVRRWRGGARRTAGPACEGQGSRRRRRDARGDGPPRLQARRQGFPGVFAPRDARGARARSYRAQERPRLQGLYGACRPGGHARRRPAAARPHDQRHGEGRRWHADRSVRRPPRPQGRGAAPREPGLCRGPGADPARRALCRALRLPGGRRNDAAHEGDGELGRGRLPGARARVAGILTRAGRAAPRAHVRSAGGLRAAATTAPGAESRPEKAVRVGPGALRAARVAAEGSRSQRSLRAPAGAGRRLALFLPVRASDYRVSGLDFVLLALSGFVAWVAVGAVLAGFEGELNPLAIPMYLASISLVLGTALLVALAYGAQEKLLSLAVALSASQPWFELVVPAASGLGEVVLWILVGWTLIA